MVALELLKPEDFALVAKWLCDPDIHRWLSSDWRKPDLSARHIAIAVRDVHNRFFLIRYNDSPCGVVAFAEMDRVDNTAMLWYFLGDKSLTGKGITSLAVRHAIAVGFSEIGLVSIYAWAMLENVASQTVLRKAGFKEAGRLRSSASLDGNQTDRIYFDLLASDSR